MWFGYFFIELSAVINDTLTVLHTQYYYNIGTSPYWAHPCLPFRAECVTTSGTQKLLHTCHSASIYGGYENIQKAYSISIAEAGVTVTTSNTPLIALRLRSAYNYCKAIPTYVDIMNLSTVNNQYVYIYVVLILNGGATITGGSWTNLTNSIIEYNATSTSFSGTEYLIIKDILFSNARSSLQVPVKFSNISASLNGLDTYLIYAKTNINISYRQILFKWNS